MSTERHIAIYARVSSRKQSMKSQEPDLERWAATQDDPIVWYRDTFTGKTMDRPDWNRLEANLRAGKVIKVACWKLDRLGRTTLELLQLHRELTERRVGFVTITEGINIDTPAGRKFFRDLASAAEYENEIRSERVRAGQAVARAQGKRWGGSVKGKRKKATPTQERAILRMKAEGETMVAISKAVGLSRMTCYSILKGT